MTKHGIERSDSANQPGRAGPGDTVGAPGSGAAPTVSSVTPDNERSSNYTVLNIAIEGANFQAVGHGSTTVFLGAQQLANVTVDTDIAIFASGVPDPEPAQTAVDVIVTNANGTATLVGGFTWTA